MLFLLRLLALALFIYSVSLVFTSNFNMGNLLVWLLTAAVDVYAIWQQPIHHWLHGTIPGKIVFVFLLVFGILYAVLLGFVAFSGYANPATGQEKVVIVLGAGLRKDRPSLLLRYRLDKAYEYAVAHPDALVITTGGQGRDEWVPEGQAMRNYLIEKDWTPSAFSRNANPLPPRKIFSLPKRFLSTGHQCSGAGRLCNQRIPLLPRRGIRGYGWFYHSPRTARRDSFTQCAHLLPAGSCCRYLLLAFQILTHRVYATACGVVKPK